MRTIICPKCNKVIAVSDSQDYVICCNEVIYTPYEAHNSEDEEPLGNSGGQ